MLDLHCRAGGLSSCESLKSQSRKREKESRMRSLVRHIHEVLKAKDTQAAYIEN